jgi:DNA-binding winged helix-turn-helix (wHTH) protein
MTRDLPPSSRFGAFVLDMARRQLSMHGQIIPLRRKDLELLAFLVENSDRAVSKEELLTDLWPGTVVDANNLPRHISTLRKVLADHSPAERPIETVPGWGYRFTAVVVRLNEEVAATASPSLTRLEGSRAENASPADPAAASQAPGGSTRRRWPVFVGTTLVSLLLAIRRLVVRT